MSVLALFTGACGRDQARYTWEQALLKADRAVDHRSYDDARVAYEALNSDAHDDVLRPGDRRYIQYRLSYILEREGRYEEALQGYATLLEDATQDDELAGQALYRTGYLLYEFMAREAAALEAWERAMTELHDTIAAGKSLREILSHYARKDESAQALSFIDRVYPGLAETEIGDNLMFRRAEILRDQGDVAEAAASYKKVITDHEESGLVDNARWELAELYQETSQYEEALVELKTLAEDRETSWAIGTYDSEYVDDARFRRGMILLEQLNRYEDAEEEFGIFLSEFPESLLRDDARWNIVQTRLARDDGEGASDRCQTLATKEPESRWVDDCQEIIAALRAGAKPSSLRREAAD